MSLGPGTRLVSRRIDPLRAQEHPARDQSCVVLMSSKRSGTMRVSVAVLLLGAMCAAPVFGQGQGQGQTPPPPATDTVAPEIPGVVKGGTKVIVIKDDFQGTEGPIALPDGALAFTEGGANR